MHFSAIGVAFAYGTKLELKGRGKLKLANSMETFSFLLAREGTFLKGLARKLGAFGLVLLAYDGAKILLSENKTEIFLFVISSRVSGEFINIYGEKNREEPEKGNISNESDIKTVTIGKLAPGRSQTFPVSTVIESCVTVMENKKWQDLLPSLFLPLCCYLQMTSTPSSTPLLVV